MDINNIVDELENTLDPSKNSMQSPSAPIGGQPSIAPQTAGNGQFPGGSPRNPTATRGMQPIIPDAVKKAMDGIGDIAKTIKDNAEKLEQNKDKAPPNGPAAQAMNAFAQARTPQGTPATESKLSSNQRRTIK